MSFHVLRRLGWSEKKNVEKIQLLKWPVCRLAMAKWTNNTVSWRWSCRALRIGRTYVHFALGLCYAVDWDLSLSLITKTGIYTYMSIHTTNPAKSEKRFSSSLRMCTVKMLNCSPIKTEPFLFESEWTTRMSRTL